MDQGIEVNVRLAGHERIDFDRKSVRKALRIEGSAVRKEARRLVSRRAVSGGGENPGRETGALWRSIKSKVSRSGFLVKIAPQKTPEMGEDFYPAYLFYGVRRGAQRGRSHARRADNGSGWRIEPRNNFMIQALDRRRSGARVALEAALKDALVPR